MTAVAEDLAYTLMCFAMELTKETWADTLWTLPLQCGYAGRNPKTSEVLEVKPKNLPFFKCGLELKRRINSEKS